MSEIEEDIRLQKLLANHGIASRRIIEKMIVEGRITINGKLAALGDRATSEDEIRIDNLPVILNSAKEYYLLNKPQGIISTAKDELGRKNVVDLVESTTRLFPVGRLDADTSGLIILTNDGDLTHKLTHPSYGVEKKYIAELSGEVSDQNVELLRNGVELEDGITHPAKVKLLARKKDKTLLEISIHEGRNRQIRRMGDAINHPIISLQRVSIGPISDASLKAGQSRKLTPKEVFMLHESISDNDDSNAPRNS